MGVPITLITIDRDILFTRVRVDEDNGGRLSNRDVTGTSKVPVIQEPRDGGMVFTCTALDCFERLYV